MGPFVFATLADLGLERSPKAERGLVVWAIVVVFFAALTLYLSRSRGGLLRRTDFVSGDTTDRGLPFMKTAFFAVVQLASGLLAVYALARLMEPAVRRPAGWDLMSPPHEVTVLAQQADIIWAGGKEGLFAVNSDSRRIISIPQIQSRDLRGVRALLAENKQLWIACRRGLFRYDGAQLESVTPHEHDDLGPVTALCRSRDGSLWIGVQNGAWRAEPGLANWHLFDSNEGLSLPTVDVIYETRGGDLWFGSDAPEAPGLFRFDQQTRKFLDVSSGLNSHAVNDLVEDHSGVLWIATGFGSRGAAAAFTNGLWKEISDLPGIGGEKIRSLFEDSHRRIWLCSEYNGVVIREGDRWKRLTVKDGLPGAEVKDMLEDQKGRLWLATERGLGCLSTIP